MVGVHKLVILWVQTPALHTGKLVPTVTRRQPSDMLVSDEHSESP